MAKARRAFLVPHLLRYLLTGMLALLPLWVTFLVFNFLFSQLHRLGRPWVLALSRSAHVAMPDVSLFLLEPEFETALAIVIALIGLYLLGWATTRVVGRRLIAAFGRMMERIPMVKAIYGGTQKVLASFQRQPEQTQRVVLINFPSPEMKAIGFVTRILRDANDNRELAAVYIPTSPNPTSGYMELVPLDQVTPTDWTMDEAMSFIFTGGVNGPDIVHYREGSKIAVPTSARKSGVNNDK